MTKMCYQQGLHINDLSTTGHSDFKLCRRGLRVEEYRLLESYASIIRVTRISELGTTLEVTRSRRKHRVSVLQLLVSSNFVSSSPILATLMMEAIRSSETSVLTRATLRNGTVQTYNSSVKSEPRS
jgi:hypothetical protein